ncbi:MAG: hypothetical protein ACP5ID_06050, partial [Conexivisphaera sp.]
MNGEPRRHAHLDLSAFKSNLRATPGFRASWRGDPVDACPFTGPEEILQGHHPRGRRGAARGWASAERVAHDRTE